MSTYFYMRSLEVGIYYFSHIQVISFFVFLFFNSKEITLKKIVDHNGPYKSIGFFIWEVTWYKGLELGQYKSITSLKEVAKYISNHLP
jgi:hypothetical protein